MRLFSDCRHDFSTFLQLTEGVLSFDPYIHKNACTARITVASTGVLYFYWCHGGLGVLIQKVYNLRLVFEGIEKDRFFKALRLCSNAVRYYPDILTFPMARRTCFSQIFPGSQGANGV